MAEDEAARKEAFLKDWKGTDLLASSADYYFNSYNHFGVHEDVLKDTVTMSTYQRAVKQNAHLFKGAVVLDVCCGVGVCSLLAAQAGAKKVIAVDSQQELCKLAEKVARKNGFGEEALEVVCADPANLEALPGGLKEVDIIISEWMGYCLLYEARLGEVLRCRDRWLRRGGLMFPDRASLHAALLEDADYKETHFNYFKGGVWGFDYSCMVAPAHSEPVVSAFEAEQLLSQSVCLAELDLQSCSAAEAFDVATEFKIQCKRQGHLHAVLCWFEIKFGACHKPVSFATDPASEATCWKQTAFFVEGPNIRVSRGDSVRGLFALRRPSAKRRHLDVKVLLKVNNGKARIQSFRWT
eukprot:TRINITY_DN48534_c0_g1_i1.p1 TRINITY_DN48534_c0_g1~~TRINITY_DN48534_c0_g1_i1.p1  ORF type:complete len:353 (-),score=98.02 TRINITY_DN48534_c0_g1_i1:49-1107(-)